MPEPAVQEFKSRGPIAMSACAAALCSLGAAWILVVAVPVPEDAVLVSGWGLTAVFGFVFIRRAFRTKLVLDDNGVLIQNYWRTYRVPWSSVNRICAVRSSPGYAAPQSSIAFETSDPWCTYPAHATSFQNRYIREETLKTLEQYAGPRAIEIIAYIDENGEWRNPPDVGHRPPGGNR
jgi:hypothetical protein